VKIKTQPLSEQYDYGAGEYFERAAPRYSRRVGLFLNRCSALEHDLDLATAEFISSRSHQIGYLFLESLSLNARIELFRKLLEARLSDDRLPARHLRELRRIVKQLHDLRVFRNRVAHANWATLGPSGYVRTKVQEKAGAIHFQTVRITPAVLVAWTRRLVKPQARLEVFCETVGQL
jgi:hypothetical protein